MFNNIFSSKVEQLWSLYEATVDIAHPGEKGSFREVFVRSLISSVIPFHYGVGSGVIVDKWGEQSPQIDLLIYDKRLLPPLMEEVGHGIYPIDSVLRIVEVKSTLQKSDLSQLERLCRSVDPNEGGGLKMASKGKLENGRSYYPFVSLIAYKSNVADIKDTICQSFPALSQYISQLCIIEKGVFKTDKSLFLPNENKVNNIKMFLVILLAAIEDTAASRKEFSISEWISFSK